MLINITAKFPDLTAAGYTRTSLPSIHYNCIAWAAGDDSRWWEPDPIGMFYWPDGVRREYSMRAYVAVFEKLGFQRCDNPSLEADHEKIAIYVKGGRTTHAAKQLADGRWSSKLGDWDDIIHVLDGLNGGTYGAHSIYLRRPKAV